MYKKKKKNVKKFRKNFNTRIIRSKQTYSIDEIASLLNVHVSAVHRWHKEGLQAIDKQQPYLIFGQDLIEFLKARTSSKKRPCQPYELFCCKCQQPQKPRDNNVCMKITTARSIVAGFCEVCGTKISKAISPNKINLLKEIFFIQAVHEEDFNRVYQDLRYR